MKKYLDNQNFINWVYNPNEESDRYMSFYLLKHPEEEVLVNELKEVLLAIRNEGTIKIPDCKAEVFDAINKRINENSKKKEKKEVFHKFYKYAALLIVSLGILSFFVFNKKEHNYNLDNTQVVSMDTVSSTQLILGNKEAVVIESKESEVHYKKNGNILVNKKEARTTAKQNGELNQLLVPFGKRSKIVLEDNTIVYLNAGSKFLFPPSFTGKNTRTVFLEGEAYFEVTTNKSQPFVVKTLHQPHDIEVLGTKFNVSAYPEEGSIKTVLKEGSVKIINKSNLFSDKETLLKPNQLSNWNKLENNVVLQEVNSDLHSAWIHGYLSFNRESLDMVVEKLVRYYNVSISFQNQIDNKKKVTGKLDLNDDIDTTLKNLLLTSKLDIKKINKNEYIIK